MKYYSNYPGNQLSKQTYDPLEEENKILKYWKEQKSNKKVQENRHKNNDGIFTILNGPPFPTGSPHSGHILNAVIKDVFTRYAHQKNLEVVNRFGWDCHGLPVEHEVNKKFEIKEPEDLYHIGGSKYNEECRKFVQRHEPHWKTNLNRIGIAVDLTGAYSTMSKEFMEAVWGLFKQLFDRGLVYRDTKILPYSSGCFTHLSHFEAQQNMKTIHECTALVAFRIVESDAMLLIWVESPWKLSANFAVCVKPTAIYVKVKIISDELIYIVSKNRLNSVFPHSKDFSVLEEFKGEHIALLRYHPLFDYGAGNFTILLDDSICDDLGTGIVALCPHFNQNDYRICVENGLSPDKAPYPLDSCGRFTRSVIELAGLRIKEVSLFVLQSFQKHGLLMSVESVERERRHCWRSDVRLIDKASSSWFLKVENLKEKLNANNEQITWVPSFYKEKIENHFDILSDWPIGRDKHWGTPIPIWSSPSGDEIRCIGSISELLELTSAKEVSDLHKESLDTLFIPSSVPGNPPLRRVSEVFDCWFESGMLPIFEQKENRQTDLFIEGQDQINGWFLTSSILSAAFSLPAPSKTILVHGLIKNPNRMKLSKRKHNFNDAIKIAEKYGADALRVYLVTSPLMTGESFNLTENEVGKFKETLFQPFYKMLYDLMPLLGKEGWVAYGTITETTFCKNIFDKWILSRAEALVQFYESELKAYRLHLVIPRIIEFLEQFHRYYIPTIGKDKNANGFVVFNVMYKMCLVLAPFAPFFTEYIYQIFKPWTCLSDKDFVHNLPLTEKSDKLIEPHLDLIFSRWQEVIEMVCEARRKIFYIPIGYRIMELIVVHPLANYLDDTEILNENLVKLVNVHLVTRTTDRAQFGIRLKAELKEDSTLSQNLSQDEFEKIDSTIQKLSDKEVSELIGAGSENILGQCISVNEVRISHVFEEVDRKSVIISRDEVCVVIKMNKDLSYYEHGIQMEIEKTIKKLRKKANVYPNEFLTVCYSIEDDYLETEIEAFVTMKNTEIISISKFCVTNEELILKQTVNIKGISITFNLFKIKEKET